MQINIINIMHDILLKLYLLCQMKTVECTTQALEFSMLLSHFTLLFQNYYTSLCTAMLTSDCPSACTFHYVWSLFLFSFLAKDN